MWLNQEFIVHDNLLGVLTEEYLWQSVEPVIRTSKNVSRGESSAHQPGRDREVLARM